MASNGVRDARTHPRTPCPTIYTQATAVWDTVGVGLQPLLRVLNAAIPRFARTRTHKPRLPNPPAPQLETSPAELETILARLDGSKQQWIRVGTKERARMLKKCLNNFIDMLVEFAEASSTAKGSYESGLGDEM